VDETTSTPGDTAAPVATKASSTVDFQATLMLSLREFNILRRQYALGVAHALHVPSTSVSIGKVSEIASRRRLLSTVISVDTLVIVENGDARIVAGAATATNLNYALGPAGMGVGTVSTPHIAEGDRAPLPGARSPVLTIVLALTAGALFAAALVWVFYHREGGGHHYKLASTGTPQAHSGSHMGGRAPGGAPPFTPQQVVVLW